MPGTASIWGIGPVPVDPITLIAHTEAGTTGVSATSSAIDTTGANCIVIAQSGLSGGTSPPTDSNGNTWTPLTERSGGSLSVRLFYCLNPTVGPGHTFTTIWGGGSFTSIAVGAFNNVLNAAPDAETGAGSASGTTQQPGSITPSVANCLIVTGLEYVSGTVPGPATVDSGFTIIGNAGNAATSVPVALAYKIQGAAAAENPTWSSNAGSERIAAAMAAFKHN